MGIYVNPGNTAFKEAVNSLIYVDKSELISYMNQRLNTVQKNICVSRPRYFGKSMAADMLVAYYSRGCRSKALFSGRKAEKGASFSRHLNRHNVIRLDMQRFLESGRGLATYIAEIERKVIRELRETFPRCSGFGEEDRLKEAFEQIFRRTKKRFIFIIDEWDWVFRTAREQREAQRAYLDFLGGLLKGAEYVELVYMTGILPVKKYGEDSLLPDFEEDSMMAPGELAGMFGFTGEEVRALCLEKGVNFAEMRTWYDGYFLDGLHIYNPKSVTEALRQGKFKAYWTRMETYGVLKEYVDQGVDGMREAAVGLLGNGRCRINFRRFRNDMVMFYTGDDVLVFLVHLGYLSFDGERGEVFIPNQEIRQEWWKLLEEPEWSGLAYALNRWEKLLERTLALDGDGVAEEMEAIHSRTESLLCYDNGYALAGTVLIAYHGVMKYYEKPIVELFSGKGIVDIAYLPRQHEEHPALVVELRWDQSGPGAIWQIWSKTHAAWLRGYRGDILLVGINYDRKLKRYTCVIEAWRKE